SSFMVMDAEEMNLTGSFDVIWTVASSTHFQNQGRYIKTATDLLNEGGKFVVFDWMASESISDISNDPYLKPVSEGMLLFSLSSLNTFVKWFIESGYRIICAEDITDRTIRTWDDALSIVGDPAIWRLAPRLKKGDLVTALHFIKSVGAMKLAMQKGKLKSGLVVAEKL
ncbi:MAG TPA: methyltransferase domain-containing protein, partial [Dehalococcoidales bacterium]|nr:methyltransferase domain-containing protein [Dehalococcoidales bacterium]